MKKIVIVALCSIFLLIGCANKNLDSVKIEDTTFDLVADHFTGIIYIKNSTHDGYYIYTPYYSKNGKLCRYDDGLIVEIEEKKKRNIE